MTITGQESRSFKEFYVEALSKGYMKMCGTGPSECADAQEWFKKYNLTQSKYSYVRTKDKNYEQVMASNRQNALKARDELDRRVVRVAIAHLDTDGKLGPNHFLIIAKDRNGVWKNLDHTSSDSYRRSGNVIWENIYKIIYVK